MSDEPPCVTETSRDLVPIREDDALLDLVSGWFVLAEDAHDAITAFVDSRRKVREAGGRVRLNVSRESWDALREIARRHAPTAPIAPVRESECGAVDAPTCEHGSPSYCDSCPDDVKPPTA